MMQKYKKQILILIIILIVIVAFSYVLFISGITNKMGLTFNKLSANLKSNKSVSSYPIINMVINSSGEKVVNEDVTLTVMAESNYKIDNFYYTYDMKKWYSNITDASYGKNANCKITFKETMDSKIYIKAKNILGYESYAYEVTVRIDKEKPNIKVKNVGNDIIINASDNVGVSSIQYSNDKVTWEEKSLSDGQLISLKINDFSYRYVRLVDTSGNISDIKSVK